MKNRVHVKMVNIYNQIDELRDKLDTADKFAAKFTAQFAAISGRYQHACLVASHCRLYIIHLKRKITALEHRVDMGLTVSPVSAV